jgi:hypothetical protein
LLLRLPSRLPPGWNLHETLSSPGRKGSPMVCTKQDDMIQDKIMKKNEQDTKGCFSSTIHGWRVSGTASLVLLSPDLAVTSDPAQTSTHIYAVPCLKRLKHYKRCSQTHRTKPCPNKIHLQI